MIKDFPAVTPSDEHWDLEFNTQAFPSALNRAIQTRVLPGAKWHAALTFNNREGKDARLLQGFFSGLQGRAGRFWLTPSDWQQLGTPSGNGVLDATLTQGASVMQTRGWEAFQPELFFTGDLFEINGEMKQVTSTAASDANGYATIEFSPPVRVTLAAGTPIRYDEPRCQMMLSDDSVGWQITSPVIYSLTVNCEEAIDV